MLRYRSCILEDQSNPSNNLHVCPQNLWQSQVLLQQNHQTHQFLLMKQENHQLIIVKPPFFDASTHILPFGYLTVRHGKIHHAIKFGKPGKPSISMGHGLTMAMLKNQRVYIYIYMVGRLWWMIFLGRLWWMIQKWISKIIHHNLPKIIPNNFHVLGRWLRSIWRLWWMIFFSTRG